MIVDLPETQMMMSQIPAIPEYVDAFRAEWGIGRHAENWQDIKSGIGESIKSNTRLKQAVELSPTVAIGGLLVYELSPGNENKIASIVLNRFVSSGGTEILDPAVHGGLFTLGLEGLLVVGAVYALNKFKPAVDVIRKSYFSSLKPADIDNAEVDNEAGRARRLVKKVGRTAANAAKLGGVAFSTGAFTATAVEDASRPEASSIKKNAKFGAKVAGALAVNNTALAAAILYGRKTGTPYLADACENIANGIRDPYIMGGVYGTIYSAKRLLNKRKIKKQLALNELTQHPEDQTLISENKVQPAR